MLLHLSDVSSDGLPPFDLSLVVRRAPAHIITAVPLKPSAWIIFPDPALLFPNGQRLAGVYAKKIKLWIVFKNALLLKFGFDEPILGEFFRAIPHIHAPKNPNRKHLLWGEFWLKVGMKILPHGLGAFVAIMSLHLVMYDNGFLHMSI